MGNLSYPENNRLLAGSSTRHPQHDRDDGTDRQADPT
jgi:hypothetical protein